MKLTIDIEDSSFAEYFEEADGSLDLTKLAIDAVIKAFTEKCRWDDAIRDYIKREIKDGLHAKIYEYKNSDMIKDMAHDIVKDTMKPINTGSVIVTLETKRQIAEQVKKSMTAFNMSLNDHIKDTVKSALVDMIRGLNDKNKMREFIDYEKLSAYVVEGLYKEDEDADNTKG